MIFRQFFSEIVAASVQHITLCNVDFNLSLPTVLDHFENFSFSIFFISN